MAFLLLVTAGALADVKMGTCGFKDGGFAIDLRGFFGPAHMLHWAFSDFPWPALVNLGWLDRGLFNHGKHEQECTASSCDFFAGSRHSFPVLSL